MSKLLICTCSFTLLFGTASARADGEILRHADGSVVYLNAYDALNACPSGMHLPVLAPSPKELGTCALK